MKLCILAPTPPPTGGIAGWTMRMMNARLKNGWEVSVVDEKMQGKRNVKGGDYKNLFIEVKRCVSIWKELKENLKEGVDVVQACIPATNGALLREIISAEITKHYKTSFITHFRCTVPNMVKSKTGKSLLGALVKRSSCVFCLNQQTIDYIHKEFGEKKHCELIPNFIDTSEMFERVEYSDHIKRIVYTGRIYESKGCKKIIEVARQFPEIQFVLIGKVLMDCSSVPDNVLLTGEKDKMFIQSELKNADVFLFPSEFIGEGFSNSLAEAMAYSLPCIVSDWAANRDMIEDKGGIVLDNITVECIADAIHSIMSKTKREEMGAWNYSKVINSYSQDIIIDKYVDCYESVIKK